MWRKRIWSQSTSPRSPWKHLDTLPGRKTLPFWFWIWFWSWKVWHLDETLLGIASYCGPWIPQTSPWVHFRSLNNHQVCVIVVLQKFLKQLQVLFGEIPTPSCTGIRLRLCDLWFLCNRELSTSALAPMPIRNISSQTFLSKKDHQIIMLNIILRLSWFLPRYFVLVHDSYSSVDDAAAAEIFTKIQNAFDSTFCHFLQVNRIRIFLWRANSMLPVPSPNTIRTNIWVLIQIRA